MHRYTSILLNDSNSPPNTICCSWEDDEFISIDFRPQRTSLVEFSVQLSRGHAEKLHEQLSELLFGKA